jgi:hypothetical protein
VNPFLVKLCEYQAALGSFESALDMAKAQRDTAAEGAIKKAIDDVNKKIVQELKKEEQKGDEGWCKFKVAAADYIQ